ncbi:MAG: protein kinase [Gammaproteobacteria bacterium]|nr:protein kinase [Gammaproteobacteria bacterium]
MSHKNNNIYHLNKAVSEEKCDTCFFLDENKKKKNFLALKFSKPTSKTTYAIDMENCLGEGTFGKVYKSYQVKNNKVITCHEKLNKGYWIAKFIIRNERIENQLRGIYREHRLLSNYYKTETPVAIQYEGKNYYLLISEFIPGKDLYKGLNGNDIKNFTFEQKVELAWQLALSVNQIGNNTPSTGNAVIHKDIKLENIIFNKDQDGRIHAYVIDFGLGYEISGASKAQSSIYDTSCSGTLQYMPLELLDKTAGLKSDIYALAGVLLCIFGATNPFFDKRKARNEVENFRKCIGPQSFKTIRMEAVIRTSFNFQGLFQQSQLPQCTIKIRALVCYFFKRMASRQYNSRADNLEVLRFFTSLRLLCRAKTSQDKKTEIICLAKLCLLAQGAWYQNIFSNTLDKFSTSKTKSKNSLRYLSSIKTKGTFEQYAFGYLTSKIIVHLYKKKQLTRENIEVWTLTKIKQYIVKRKAKRDIWRWGYTKKQKIAAAQLLIDIFEDRKKIDALFAKKNKTLYDALGQGGLGKLACRPLMQLKKLRCKSRNNVKT